MRGQIIRIKKEPETFPDYGKGNCLYCGEPLPPRKRKYCSWGHGHKYRIAVAEYHYYSWADIRDEILERDSHVCKDCGDEAVEVHHKLPLYKGGEEYDKDNCISLCHSCHVKRHKGRNTKVEMGKIKQLCISEFNAVKSLDN